MNQNKTKTYLDYAATTPIDDEVLNYMVELYRTVHGNPSSMYKSGRDAARELQNARKKVASCIGAQQDEIYFTGSGTESDNLALFGIAQAYKKYGKHIIVSSIEHKAIMESSRVLESQGFEITYAPVNRYGRIDIDQVLSLIRPDTILVSIMFVNNELGTIQPIKELFQKIRNTRQINELPILHTDACQAAGHIKLDVHELNIDLMTLNGSKIYGPKGIGILYKKNIVRIEPCIVGGSQESGIRAGTESIPQIAGVAYALEKSVMQMQDQEKHLAEIKKYTIEKIRHTLPHVLINTLEEHTANHIVHMTIPDIEGESIVLLLDQYGIEVATGSACSSNDLRPSHVLEAIGQDEQIIHGSIRISFGKSTTKSDIDYFIESLSKIINQLRNISVLTTQTYELRK